MDKSVNREEVISDFEKVIKGLGYCKEYFDCCDQCPYWDGGLNCVPNLTKEALEVLKAQAARIEELEYDLREARGNKHVQ